MFLAQLIRHAGRASVDDFDAGREADLNTSVAFSLGGGRP